MGRMRQRSQTETGSAGRKQKSNEGDSSPNREPAPMRSYADDPSNSATVQLPSACHLKYPSVFSAGRAMPGSDPPSLDSGVGV